MEDEEKEAILKEMREEATWEEKHPEEAELQRRLKWLETTYRDETQAMGFTKDRNLGCPVCGEKEEMGIEHIEVFYSNRKNRNNKEDSSLFTFGKCHSCNSIIPVAYVSEQNVIFSVY